MTPAPAVSITPQVFLAQVTYSPWDHILALAWSPGGDLLASAAGSQVYVYRYPHLSLQATLPVGVRVGQMAFDPASPPANPWLAMAVRDGSLQIWDAQAGKQMATWEAHRRSANSLAFSPDGESLASTGNDAMVRLWNLAAFHQSRLVEFPLKAEMIGGAVAVPAVRFSPDGSLLASVDLGAIRLRDPRTQRLVRTLRTSLPVFTIEFSPDGHLLAAAEQQGRVEVWDVTSGEFQATWLAMDEPRGFIWALAFSPEGSRLAAAGSTGSLTIWDVSDGKMLTGLKAQNLALAALAFSPDGRVLAMGGLDGVLNLWQAAP